MRPTEEQQKKTEDDLRLDLPHKERAWCSSLPRKAKSTRPTEEQQKTTKEELRFSLHMKFLGSVEGLSGCALGIVEHQKPVQRPY
jgi:hypothetical protein